MAGFGSWMERARRTGACLVSAAWLAGMAGQASGAEPPGSRHEAAATANPGKAGDAGSAADAANAAALALLNAVRARGADCGEGPARLASAAPVSDATHGPGRGPLSWNPMLALAAERHSEAMARTRLFDHVGVDGTTVRDRVDATGYRWQLIGENLAAGQSALRDAIADWLASRSHCTALLDPRYTEVGLARTASDSPADPYAVYWTLVLGRPR
jgi:hypothetical protein